MTEANDMPSGEEPGNTDQTETPQSGAEEQPTAVIPPMEAAAQETLADEPTMLIPAENSSQETATVAVVADEPTAFIAPATLAASGQETVAMETADEQTMLMPPARFPDPAAQVEPFPRTHEQAGEAFPATQTAPEPESVSDALLTEQSPIGYPPALAYTPNYAQLGYPPTVAYAQPGDPQGMYQQPSMPLQPGQAGLSTPPRKRRTGLWVALIIAVVLLLGSGTALALVASQQPTNTPTQALQQFCDGYKTLNAQEVYNTLSDASKLKTSLAQLQQTFDEIKKLSSIAKFSACTVSNVQQKDSTATGTITLAVTVSFDGFSSTSSISTSVGLVLENHTWKVDATKINTNVTVPTFPPDFLTPTVPNSSNQ